MENLKLVHQLFIGKVVDEIGIERTTELLEEAKEAFAIPVVNNCKHSYVMIGHQFNAHYECTKCGHQKDLYCGN